MAPCSSCGRWSSAMQPASGSVMDWDLESAGGGSGLSSRADEAPSFARRTLLWIRGHL